MIRARKLSNVHVKRSLKPLYGFTQATPYAAFLDTSLVASTTVINPGMVARRSTNGGELVALATNEGHIPFGLFGNFINGDLDELGDSTEVGVWRGAADATFEVLSDAIEADTWTNADTSTAQGALVFHSANGKLTINRISGTTQLPVARLIAAPSNSKVIIGFHTTGPLGINPAL